MFNVEDRKPSKQYFQTDTIFRVCGRIFEARSAQAATATACTWSAPFKWGVHFDGGEIIGNNTETILNVTFFIQSHRMGWITFVPFIYPRPTPA